VTIRITTNRAKADDVSGIICRFLLFSALSLFWAGGYSQTEITVTLNTFHVQYLDQSTVDQLHQFRIVDVTDEMTEDAKTEENTAGSPCGVYIGTLPNRGGKSLCFQGL